MKQAKQRLPFDEDGWWTDNRHLARAPELKQPGASDRALERQMAGTRRSILR